MYLVEYHRAILHHQCELSETSSYEPRELENALPDIARLRGCNHPRNYGRVLRYTVQFYPLSVQFGEQRVKTSSSQTTVGVENNGTTTVTLGSVSIQGSEFSIAQNNCGTTLARNTGCSLEVVFTPSATGGRAGSMSVTASDSSSPHTAALQGTGISNGIGTLSSSTLSFGTQKVGTQSKPQQVTFTNTGTGTLTLSGIAISPRLFTQSNTCASSLAAGAHCTVSVQFAPSLQGLLAGSLSIQDDGSGGQHTLVLSGIGQ